jgi:hypothetical protein
MIKKIFLFFICASFLTNVFAQQNDSLIIRNLFSEALTSNISYENLRYLCKNIGGRICGTNQAELAVQWVYNLLQTMELDSVYLQEIMVKQWLRGEKEYSFVKSSYFGMHTLNCCALGGSIGTGISGISSGVIEVQNFDELKKLGKEKVEGKIVFFNRPADQKFIITGPAYGSAADQRVYGAIEAANLGAIGVVIRSLTLSNDYFPHTGIMRYVDTIKKIPAIAISTKDADFLSGLLKLEPDLQLYLKISCTENPDVKSYNVIGEIKGSEKPEEIILIGGHLDSWDIGEGAHDDGAGVIQCLEVLRLFKKMNIRPKHTIRFVAFMDEEIAQRGARKYAEWVKLKNEKHLVAIESDAGAFTPFGFSFETNDSVYNNFLKWRNLLLPYELYSFYKGGSGVDVSFLRNLNIPMLGLIVDSQRYFDYHHSPNDIFENVNRRELQLCSAAIASVVYIIDNYGL